MTRMDNPDQRALKLLVLADELGWTTGRITVAIRLPQRSADAVIVPFRTRAERDVPTIAGIAA